MFLHTLLQARHHLMKEIQAKAIRGSELGLSLAELAFLDSATDQIINCRRMLKWTYGKDVALGQNHPGDYLLSFVLWASFSLASAR